MFLFIFWLSVQFSSVTQSWPTLCDPMNRSTPGLPVHHQLLEFTQTHIHRVSDAIQLSHPLSSPSPAAGNFEGLNFSVHFSHSVLSDSLRPYEPQHARPPCPSPTSRVHPNSCPLSQWCHPTISPSVVPFSSCSESFPASGSFKMSQLFASRGQSIRLSASTSVLPMNTQDWSP